MKQLIVTENQLTKIVSNSVRNILESLNETPIADKGLSDDEKKKARRKRGGYEDGHSDSWAADSKEEKRQDDHKSSRGFKQDLRKKGRPTRRGEFSGKLINGDY